MAWYWWVVLALWLFGAMPVLLGLFIQEQRRRQTRHLTEAELAEAGMTGLDSKPASEAEKAAFARKWGGRAQ